MESYSKKSGMRRYTALLGAVFSFFIATLWISADSLFLHVTQSAEAPRVGLSHTIPDDAGKEKDAIVMPALDGIDARDARITLEDMGLTVSVRGCDGHAESTEAVIYTQPPSGTQVARGDRITLFVQSSEKADSVRCPDLCGMCRLDAISALRAYGLEVGRTEGGEGRLYSSKVRSQSRLPGTFIPKGSSVDIVLEADTLPDIQPEINGENVNIRFNFKQGIEKHKDFWRKRAFRWHITRQEE